MEDLTPSRILIVRLGAMGDIIHTLPAADTLRRSFPSARLAWAVEPRWRPLLEGNGIIDEFVPIDRASITALGAAVGQLRRGRFELAVDFQGLIKSALVTRISGARVRYGLHAHAARESLAAWLYNQRYQPHASHIVDRHLEIATAAGATVISRNFPLPDGSREGELPGCDFVLASPFAGWASKQWPIDYYVTLARELDRAHGVPLVLNMPKAVEVPGCAIHVSGIPGLIDATRRAAAVVGVDSGPLHLAAALGKPGAAIFGPTDPQRNGPYGNTIQVLRHPSSVTTYKRDAEIGAAMRRITPEQVLAAIGSVLRSSAAC